MYASYTHTFDFGDSEVVAEYDIEYTYKPGTPARCSGPVEACHPAEEATIEILRIECVRIETIFSCWVAGIDLQEDVADLAVSAVCSVTDGELEEACFNAIEN